MFRRWRGELTIRSWELKDKLHDREENYVSFILQGLVLLLGVKSPSLYAPLYQVSHVFLIGM